MPVPCGRCMPCLLNRRRTWTHRLLLEQAVSSDSCFVTLTYNKENLPEGNTLVPKDAQTWLKRLRKKIEPTRIRFYLCGEYGDNTQRPHYHVALFGIGLEYSKIIEDTWGKGFTYTGDLTKDSAQYIAGYVTKKMTSIYDPRLNGRHPEFARMSNRPGIGANAMPQVADVLTTDYGCNSIDRNGDVPFNLKHGGKDLPLGRYLRSKIRQQLGYKETGATDEAKLKFQVQMLATFTEELQKEENKNKSLQKILTDKHKPQILAIEAKSKIFNQRKSL